MPDVTARGFSEALTELLQRLNRAKEASLLRGYGLIGGFAAAAWGVPRATHDIDFALATTGDHRRLAETLGAQFQPGEPGDPLRGVFHLSILTRRDAIPVQLVVLPPRWTEIALGDLQTLSVFGCSVPTVSWQALVLLKIYAGGPQDLADARAVLSVRQPKHEEISELSRLADTVGLSEECGKFLARGDAVQ